LARDHPRRPPNRACASGASPRRSSRRTTFWAGCCGASHPALRDAWVFKGGTCLKKCFVETYRFSEDLDFTVLDDGPHEPDDLIPVLDEMLESVESTSGLELRSRPPRLRMRPDGRSAEGRIYYRGPPAPPARRASSRPAIRLRRPTSRPSPTVASTIAQRPGSHGAVEA
jgi:hypothetical protein